MSAQLGFYNRADFVNPPDNFSTSFMIQHTVAFRLHHPASSEQEGTFFHEVKKLRSLPGVMDFKVMRQISSKNDFTWGLSMYFSSQQSYDSYNNHPVHVKFVETIWLPEVADFMEIDYVEEMV